MIGRADIEGSKRNVAMNAWLPQASCPCGNFSDTSNLKLLKTKGSIGHSFAVCIPTENQNQASFHPFVLREISVLAELALGHLCYHLTDVPPSQTPNLTLSRTQIGSDARFQGESPLKRKENSFRGPRRRLRVRLRCRAYQRVAITAFRFRNVNPIPFR